HERRWHPAFQPVDGLQRRAAVREPLRLQPRPRADRRLSRHRVQLVRGLIPLRGFVDKGQGRDGKPHNIWIPADDTAPDKLATFAAWANREGAAVYVIPGTVAEQGQARAADVLQMQAIVVDLDAGDIPEKLDHVTRHLGAPTLIIESGGRTPEGAAKLHVWWQLTEPAE